MIDDQKHEKHYLDVGSIEPIDYIIKNNLDFLEGNVVKYVSRYKYKDGIKDLEKARVYLNWLIDREQKKNDRTMHN